MARTLKLRLGVIALVTLGLALTGLAPARQALQQRELIRQEQAKLEALEKRNEELRSRLARLEDPAYREKLAREQLGVVRPGETSYVIVPPSAPVQPAPSEPVDKPWTARTLEWLGKLLPWR
ncbi:MAG: septum formation initiator family protein [Actinomycetota bacterium]|nr:septum formation initiator family protein [Actinomycetota bacterium]